MDEQVVKYREAKIMEPIYRMYKVIEEEDVLKAQTLMSVTMQYIIEHYSGKPLRPADVQQILRAVLLREDDGKYYALYVHNELQVKVAEWLTLLCVDLPVTLEQLGDMVNRFADELNGKDYITLKASGVIGILKEIAADVNLLLLERLTLNESIYLTELQTFLVQ